MKIKYIDKRGWRRVTNSTYKERLITRNNAAYLIGLISIHAVTEPLTVRVVDKDVRVVAPGYKWLTIMPKDKYHSITVMYDENWNVLQYYIDINYEHILVAGEARRIDLYLDVLVLPSGEKEVVDKKDLKKALKTGKVTREQFDFAYSIVNKVVSKLDTDFKGFTDFCEQCRLSVLKSSGEG